MKAMNAMNAMARWENAEARDTKRSLTSDALTPGAAQRRFLIHGGSPESSIDRWIFHYKHVPTHV